MSAEERKRILVVEPDPDLSEETAADLRLWGIKPVLAESHFQAFSIQDEYRFPLLLVSMDQTGIDGLEFCRIYRKRQQESLVDYAYIILLGASWHRSSICESKSLADDFLIRPFMKCELKWRVMTGLEHMRIYKNNSSAGQFSFMQPVLNENGLQKVLYQEMNRIGRKSGYISLAVLDFQHRDMMEISLGRGLAMLVKKELLRSFRKNLRNYGQLGRTDKDRICIVSGDNDLQGITGLLYRLITMHQKLDLDQPGVSNFDLALGGSFVSLQVHPSNEGSMACAENVYKWLVSLDSFPFPVSGRSGFVDEKGIHLYGEPVTIQVA